MKTCRPLTILSASLRVALFLALLFPLLACACAPPVVTAASQGLPVGESRRVLMQGNRQRSYIVYVPASIDWRQPVPLVLVFHGGLGNAQTAIQMSGFHEIADQGGFVVAYPNGTGLLNDDKTLTWNAGTCCGFAQEANIDDVGFVRALVSDLRSQLDIDVQRIYATGMSNGGMLAHRLGCEAADVFAAVAPVAGTLNFSPCSPARPVAMVAFHGTADPRVPYEGGEGVRGVNFSSVSDSIQFWTSFNACQAEAETAVFADVRHERWLGCLNTTAVELYTIVGGGHSWPGGPQGDADTLDASALIWQFFADHPVVSSTGSISSTTSSLTKTFLPVITSVAAERPRGIFVLAGLGGPQGGVTQSLEIIEQVADLDYIEGVTIGFSWADTEASPGQYDFSKVDAVMAALSSTDKKLNIEVFAVEVPAYLVAQLPADETWDAQAPGRRTVKTAVPWSQAALKAWEVYMQALADHAVPLADGTRVRLADHPTLSMLDAPIVGLQDVRDLTNTLTALPGYERGKLITAVMRSVHASRDVFPEKFGFLGFFRINDADMVAPLDQEILARLMDDFNQAGQPTLGFFQETLSDAGPRADGLGKCLFTVKDQTYIVFQALTAWVKPFTGAEAVASGKAATGIQFAHETYRTSYVEIYLADVLDAQQTEALRQWNTILIGGGTP